MVIWPVLPSSRKTADLVLACFGWFRSQRVNASIFKNGAAPLSENNPGSAQPCVNILNVLIF